MKYFVWMLMIAMVLAGCESKDDARASANQPENLPSSLLLTRAPDGAKDVRAVKASAKDGDTVVVRGVIGGRVDPIASNRAILTILDPSIPTCDKNSGDACKTPW